MINTLILKIQFDGTDFRGWQIQPSSRTVQDEIQKAIKNSLNINLNIIASGRTDSGVHARSQIVSAIIPKEILIPKNKIRTVLNSYMPSDILIIDSHIFNDKFDARRDAIAREYSYTIQREYDLFNSRYSTFVRDNLDIKLMNQCSKIILGDNDFTSFSKKNNELEHYRSIVEYAEWTEINDKLQFNIKANRFVYGMVRCLVGNMIKVGSGKIDINDFAFALIEPNRKYSRFKAEAKGLIFEKAYYKLDLNILR